MRSRNGVPVSLLAGRVVPWLTAEAFPCIGGEVSSLDS